MLFAGAQTQLVVHCGRQKTWLGLAATRLVEKLTLGGDEAGGRCSGVLTYVSGVRTSPAPGPPAGREQHQCACARGWAEGERATPWHRALPICLLF